LSFSRLVVIQLDLYTISSFHVGQVWTPDFGKWYGNAAGVKLAKWVGLGTGPKKFSEPGLEIKLL